MRKLYKPKECCICEATFTPPSHHTIRLSDGSKDPRGRELSAEERQACPECRKALSV